MAFLVRVGSFLRKARTGRMKRVEVVAKESMDKKNQPPEPLTEKPISNRRVISRTTCTMKNPTNKRR